MVVSISTLLYVEKRIINSISMSENKTEKRLNAYENQNKFREMFLIRCNLCFERKRAIIYIFHCSNMRQY